MNGPTVTLPALLLALSLLIGSFPPASAQFDDSRKAPAESIASSPEEARLISEAERLMEENRRSMFRPGEPLVRNRDALVAHAELLEDAGLDSLAARTLGMAAWSSYRLGQVDRAISIAERGITAAKRDGARAEEYRAANVLAVGHMAEGNPEKAIHLWFGLIPKNRAIGNLAAAGRNWGNVVQAYNLMGRIPEALEAADSAEIALAAGQVPDAAIGLAIGRGALLLQSGRPLVAAAWAETAAAHSRRLGLQPPEAIARSMRAAALEKRGRRREALDEHLAAQGILAATGDRFYQVTTQLARASIFFRMGEMDSCRSELDRARPIVETLRNPVVETATIALRASAAIAEGRQREAEPMLRAAVDRFERTRETRRRQPERPGVPRLRASEAFAALALCLVRQGRAEEAFWTAERGRAVELSVELTGGGAPTPADSDRLTEMLAASNAALVAWSDSKWNPDVIFVVDSAGVKAVVAAPDTLGAEIQAALDCMASGAPDARCRPALDRLGEAVLSPFLEHLPAGCERLYLIPPLALAGFPIGELSIAGGGGEALGDRYAISYLASASVLLLLAGRSPAEEGMLVLADPEPGAEADEASLLASATFRQLRETELPAARREARRIAIPAATTLVGSEATKGALRDQAAGDWAVVHFAAHALANPLRPAESCLLLSGADDRLTAREIERLGLAADLVVLSGCKTGGGLTFVSEGTLGLPRSFLIGGARTVVMSLWDVEDRATARFMEHFYEALRRGATRDVALKETRRAMARRGYPLRDRAAFVLTGVGHEPVTALAAHPPRDFGARDLVVLGLLAIAVAGLAVGFSRMRRGRSAG